ncbi:hypothetical protein B0T21DRAFT_115945 [Apiosordaria backusii]|uniref:Protein kinase domain-containing protein n=1 Tax=Apiosordaria backusii TaxID=314023 RepID=A0AA39ZPV2_9PEZI|nr:hypothetical protein B0T21DRAFT_115945 [Apiosordaria backusii]
MQKTEHMNNIEAFRDLQRQKQDYFAHHRRGEVWFADRRDIWKDFPAPKPGVWPGFEMHYRNPAWLRKPERIRFPWDEAGPSSTRQAAMEADQRLAQTMAVAEFKSVKVLGWGGLGVASLYEAVGKNNEKLKVVCKCDIYPHYPCISREIKCHLMTAGAKHVIQQLVLQGEGGVSAANIAKLGDMARQTADGVNINEPAEDRRKRRRRWGEDEDFEMIEAEPIGEFEELDLNEIREDMKQDARKALDANQRVLFLQFMERGRLDDHLCRAAMHKRPFPSLVLWQIFDCLFRGVIGLAYPEAFMPWDVDPSQVQIAEVTETARGLKPLAPYDERPTLVHFDIDPLNVLVDKFDEHEHNLAPLVKIADLGLVKVFNGKNTAFEYWRIRDNGKPQLYTPEQFSEEWDYLNGNPKTINSEVAGNYNWWTNLYQISIIMWQLVSLCFPEQPPRVEKIKITHQDGTESTEWGFGGFILDDKRFGHIDRDLRELINQCMLYTPSKRPTMEQMETILEKKIKRQGVDPNDAEAVEAQKYCQWLFKMAPPPKSAEPKDYKLPEGLRGWTVGSVNNKGKGLLETPEEAQRRRELNRAARTRRMNPGRILANKFSIVRETRGIWRDYFQMD